MPVGDLDTNHFDCPLPTFTNSCGPFPIGICVHRPPSLPPPSPPPSFPPGVGGTLCTHTPNACDGGYIGSSLTIINHDGCAWGGGCLSGTLPAQLALLNGTLTGV